jgi:hypothetical protein
MLREVALDLIQGHVPPALDMASDAVDERVAGVRVAKLQIALPREATEAIRPQLCDSFLVRSLSIVDHQ